MNPRIVEKNGVKVAVAPPELRIDTVQDALDWTAQMNYDYECARLVFAKQSFPESFFDLKTGLAGEILQKFTTYGVKLAIIGDFSGYTSKALADFIRESNKNGQTMFLSNEQEGIDRLLG